MFQFRRFPSYTYFIQYMILDLQSSGLLHSDICGSILACNSPQLFAAYHVLLRLPMPRHSPCALLSLTIFSNSLLCSISHAFEDFFVVFFLTSQPTFVVCFRKIFYFLFSSCIFTLLYSVFKVLLGMTCSFLGGHKWTRTTDLTLIRRAL